MTNELEERQMPEWRAATIALLMAVAVAAVALVIVDPDAASVVADACTEYWMKIHELRFLR